MIRYTVIALVMLVSLAGCQKDISPLYKVNVQRDFILPAGLNPIETHVIVLEDVDTKFLASMVIHNTNIDAVTNINTGTGRLSLSNGGFDLSFVREIKVRAVSKSDPKNNVDMYYQNQINYNQGSEIVLFNTLADLKNHFKENTVDIEVRFKLRSFSPAQLSMRLWFEYGVFAK